MIKTVDMTQPKYIIKDSLPHYSFKYNIVGELEVDNLMLARLIAKFVGKDLIYEMVDFHSARPGHDLRYGLDGSKLKLMGYEIPKAFEESLKKTVEWFLDKKNKRWLE